MTHNEADFAGRMRAKGYRLTPQRQIILDALCGFGRHAAASEVYGRTQAIAPAIDRATVYRTLGLFEQLGIVASAELDGLTVFEIAGEGVHYHLLCRACGKIDHIAAAHLESFIDHLRTAHGFEAELTRLTIPGLCKECRHNLS